MLGGFLACLQPERVHLVGALNLRLVLVDDLGFLLQLFFNKLQPLFVFHHQFVHPLFGQAGELVAHIADGVPADHHQDGGGTGNQVEEVGNGIGGVRHGLVGHGQFFLYHLFDQLGPGVLHFLAQGLGLVQQVQLHKRGIHGLFEGFDAFLNVFCGELFVRPQLLLLCLECGGEGECKDER